MDTQTGEPTGAPGSIGVRDVRGARISYRIGTTDELVLNDEYAAVRFFPEGYVPPENGTFLDAGAHIGVFAAIVSKQLPNSVVHALEPSTDNYVLLEKNLSGRTNAFAHRLALGGTNGTVRLHHAPGSVGHSVYHNPDWEGQPWEPRSAEAPPLASYEDVPCQVLADFLAEQGIERVHFLKMNIEGAEYDVLLGASEETLRSIDCMQLELHPDKDGRADRLIERLRELGFTTGFVPTDNPHVYGWLTAQRR